MQIRILGLSKARRCGELANTHGRLAVWWYGGIEMPRRVDVVPKCVVFFRRVNDDDTLGGFTRRSMGLTQLGLLRIGSIWKGDQCVGMIELATETFDLSYAEDGWTFVSPAQAATDGRPPPFPMEMHPLLFNRERSWLLDFRLAGRQNLLIPCLEFYTRCYGRSAEVRRVLATYPWDQALPRLYVPIAEPGPPNTWIVQLTERVRNADVVFLAHVRYEHHAHRCARSIYAQCERAFGNGDRHAYLKVRPWFTERAQLQIDGVWVGTDTFLGLRIRGGSEPQGKQIRRYRDHAETEDHEAELEGQPNDAVRTTRVLKQPPDFVDITDTEEPDGDGARVELYEDDFEVLGPRRVVINRRRNTGERASSARTGLVSGAGADGASTFSPGEPHGSGKNVGSASIHARIEMESEGVLRDMWKALRYLARAHPDVVSRVEWFTFEDGYQASDEPRLIGLQPYEEEDGSIPPRDRNWVYFDPVRKVPRGLLIARVVAGGKSIFVVEIQRRSHRQKPKPQAGMGKRSREKVYVEESFRGLVFTLDEAAALERWLRDLVLEVRRVRGIVQKIPNPIAGRMFTFNHAPARDEASSCEAAAKNALSKADVIL